MKNKESLTRKLTESAVMLALATVLSYFKLFDLPYGGSITLCSMLPILIIAYRFGTSWGIFTSCIYGLIQMLFGIKNLTYATSFAAAIAIILFDYIIAFGVIGLGGIFRKYFKNQTGAMAAGMVLACILRYICHVISGCTVWAGLSIPDKQAFAYSLAYNATYMLPELLITVIGTVYISGAVDFGSDNLKRRSKENFNSKAFTAKTVGFLVGAAALITDVLLFAAHLQNPDTGAFDITLLKEVNYTAVLIVTAVGTVLCAALLKISGKLKVK